MATFVVLFLLVFQYGATVESQGGGQPPVVEQVTDDGDIFGEGPLPTGQTFNGQHIPVVNSEGSGKDINVKPHIVTEKEENFGNGPLPTESVDLTGLHIPVLNDENAKEGVIQAGENRVHNIEPEHVDFLETNPSELPDGTPLVEGDIMLTPEQLISLRSKNIDRKAIIPNFYYGWNARWPPDANGDIVIPYRITDSSIVDEDIIEKSLQHWMNHTCLKFTRTTNTGEFSHLYFSRENSGCYANLGRIPVNGKPGGQLVSIGPTCADLGVIAHEVGHAIGFAHEQSRRDRDNYVIVFPENIKDNKEDNFMIENKTDNYGIPYDYTSVMHYGKRLFSKNSKLTLATKDPLKMNLIGIRNGLSFRDAKLANIMYNCTDKWLTKCNIATNPCKNEGYIGKDCKCVCRPGTNGTFCTTVTRTYYPLPTCGGNVTTATVISSPFFPGHHTDSLYCTWWIRAPVCKKPNITFTGFRTYFRSSAGECHVGGLEIRNDSLYFGQTYCGIGPTYNPLNQDIKPGDTFVASGRDLVLDFYSRYQGADTGFSVKVGFVDQPNCIPSTVAWMTTMQPTTKYHTTMHPKTMSPTMQPTTEHYTTMHPTTMNPTMQPTSKYYTTMHPTTMKPTVPPTTMKPTMHPTTINPTLHPTTMSPTMYQTTMSPTMYPTTMNPTMKSSMHPTSIGPTVKPSTTTLQPAPRPGPESCPQLNVYHVGYCSLKRYGTTWIWRGPRYKRRLNCWLKVTSHICPRTIEITYVYVPFRIVSCVGNTLMLGCKNRNRCCTRNPRRRFARYRYFIPPTGNFYLQEYSHGSRRNYFYIKIREIRVSCHKRIVLTPISPTAIVSSLHTGRGYHCEWHVQAPPGKRIRMVFIGWASTTACSLYHRMYWYSVRIRTWYALRLRHIWRRRCRRSVRRCYRRNGGLFIHRAGGQIYSYVRPLCSYRTPSPIYSYRNHLSISYQKFIRRRRRHYYAYPSYFIAKLSIY